MAYADKLFGAFQAPACASEYAGTGIGLATVQRIVHRHGEHLGRSGSRQGSVFFFTLAVAAEKASIRSVEKAHDRTPIQVLFIEDSEVDVELACIRSIRAGSRSRGTESTPKRI